MEKRQNVGTKSAFTPKKKYGSNPRWNWEALVSNGLTNLGVVQWHTQA